MSYRCHVYKITPDGETELPLCDVDHKTIDSALNCRNSKKGQEACHRWEIRGGVFVVEKGEGPVGQSWHGKIQGGIAWKYSRSFLHKTERVTVTVDDDTLIDWERKIAGKHQVDWSEEFAQGMAYMLGTLGRSPEVAATWLGSIREELSILGKDVEELPANVIKGPWSPK